MNGNYYFVYVIECNNGRFYTGMTSNLSRRIEQHVSKLGSKYTKAFGVKKIVYSEKIASKVLAEKREKQIKNWSQLKKRKLISGELIGKISSERSESR